MQIHHTRQMLSITTGPNGTRRPWGPRKSWGDTQKTVGHRGDNNIRQLSAPMAMSMPVLISVSMLTSVSILLFNYHVHVHVPMFIVLFMSTEVKVHVHVVVHFCVRALFMFMFIFIFTFISWLYSCPRSCSCLNSALSISLRFSSCFYPFCPLSASLRLSLPLLFLRSFLCPFPSVLRNLFLSLSLSLSLYLLSTVSPLVLSPSVSLPCK